MENKNYVGLLAQRQKTVNQSDSFSHEDAMIDQLNREYILNKTRMEDALNQEKKALFETWDYQYGVKNIFQEREEFINGLEILFTVMKTKNYPLTHIIGKTRFSIDPNNPTQVDFESGSYAISVNGDDVYSEVKFTGLYGRLFYHVDDRIVGLPFTREVYLVNNDEISEYYTVSKPRDGEDDNETYKEAIETILNLNPGYQLGADGNSFYRQEIDPNESTKLPKGESLNLGLHSGALKSRFGYNNFDDCYLDNRFETYSEFVQVADIERCTEICKYMYTLVMEAYNRVFGSQMSDSAKTR